MRRALSSKRSMREDFLDLGGFEGKRRFPRIGITISLLEPADDQ